MPPSENLTQAVKTMARSIRPIDIQTLYEYLGVNLIYKSKLANMEFYNNVAYFALRWVSRTDEEKIELIKSFISEREAMRVVFKEKQVKSRSVNLIQQSLNRISYGIIHYTRDKNLGLDINEITIRSEIANIEEFINSVTNYKEG